MEKNTTGLLIGRYQPFHKGHLFILKESLKVLDKLIIAIGSANIQNDKNPISAKNRQKLIEKVIKNEALQDSIQSIVLLDDFPNNDDKWLEHCLGKINNFDVIVSNDDWVINIFRNAGFNILKIPFYKRNVFKGTLIRKEFNEKKPEWKDKIPNYLINDIKNFL
ncbi:adenylyltransferase/cytidyltransferase family protein [Candidatus Dojkabacteria bacterium]|nr:adenylyltransferase/cytidyltransferase family protein [Candidatus Dojkabacteria bacterium]